MSELLQRTLGEEIQVRAKLATDLWSVEADPTELEAAILNCAVNARDAMPLGGELTIETANAELDASTDFEIKAGPYVLISVTDSGTGMKPEVLKQVFEPFFTTKAHGRGTGLGLSQVYGFVTQSGGQVTLHSELGRGTTVNIYLPSVLETDGAALSQIAEPKKHSQIPLGRAGETILVVEDDDDVRNYTVSSLRELGYIVFEAIDAASALVIIESEPSIDLLFSDLGLPGGTNGKVLGDRAKKMRASLKVLLTTAYAANILVHKGRLNPGVELLNKPFTFAALAGRIRELLDRGHERES
jgi:CheY-like chemotaxis protein